MIDVYDDEFLPTGVDWPERLNTVKSFGSLAFSYAKIPLAVFAVSVVVYYIADKKVKS